MIRTRVIVGLILALAAGGILVGDDYTARRWFPCHFVCLMELGVLARRELVRLFPEPIRPSETLVLTSVVLCLAANWYPRAWSEFGFTHGSVWGMLVVLICGVLAAAFVLEMRRYTGEPGRAVPRLGATVLAVAY